MRNAITVSNNSLLNPFQDLKSSISINNIGSLNATTLNGFPCRKETGVGRVVWINLAQGRGQWRALVRWE
jgi:hypothetical protein